MHTPKRSLDGLIWPKAGFASIASAATPVVRLSSPARRASSRDKKVSRPTSSAALRPWRVRRRSPPAPWSPSRPRWARCSK